MLVGERLGLGQVVWEAVEARLYVCAATRCGLILVCRD